MFGTRNQTRQQDADRERAASAKGQGKGVSCLEKQALLNI